MTGSEAHVKLLVYTKRKHNFTIEIAQLKFSLIS